MASGIYGYKDVDFGRIHPAGALGKKLILKVDDLMAKGNDNAKVRGNVALKDAIIELSKKGLGVVSIVDGEDTLLGVITDGDLRRQLEKEADIYSLQVEDIMTKKPITIQSGRLAVEGLKVLKENNVSCVMVMEGNKVVGTIRLQDIIGIGIVG